MYCRKCGKEISEEAVVCIHCGCMVNDDVKIGKTHSKEMDTPKTAIGVLMALFVGIIGLVIGLMMYPEGTVARKTFLKSWLITTGVTVGVAILFYVFVFVIAFATAPAM